MKRDRLVFLIALIYILLLTYLNLGKVAFLTRLEGDAISRVLPASAPLLGLGAPYKDFWEIIPPGFLLFLSLWMKSFGFSMISFKILQVSALLGIGLLSYFIMKRIFSIFYLAIVGSFSLIILFSSLLFTIFIPSEMVGLLFSLLGLMILIYFRQHSYAVLFGTFCLAFSGQIKDPFGLTILSIIPLLVSRLIIGDYKSFLRLFLFIVGGIGLAALTVIGYLYSVGSYEAYSQVLNYKSTVFDVWKFERLTNGFVYAIQTPQNIFIYYQYLIIVPLLLWGVITLISKFTSKKITRERAEKGFVFHLQFKATSRTLDTAIVLCYSLGSFLGFTAGNNFGSHYLIQIVLPIYFVWGILLNSSYENGLLIFRRAPLKFLMAGLMLLVSIILLAPKPEYFKSYKLSRYSPVVIANEILQSEKNVDVKIEKYIATKVNEDGCILSVYGWGVGDTYYYSQRKPCTRFFLANIVTQDWQRTEYRESILRNPPHALVYTPLGADMNIIWFEQSVINLSKIKDQCYVPDTHYPHLFFPKYQSNELTECVSQNAL